MTYSLSILRDQPRGLWILDAGTLTDFSGNAGLALAIAAPVASTAALVAHGGTAVSVSPSAGYKFPTRIYKPGYEKSSFSLEVWVYPDGNVSDLVSHKDEQDGIAIVGGNVVFSAKFVGSTATITYVMDTTKTMHVVGVYTPTSIAMYVNGKLYQQLNLTQAQQEDSFATFTDNGYLYAGGAETDGTSYIQAVAIYEYALSTNQVQLHYQRGRDTVLPDSVPLIYGGRVVDISDNRADIFLRELLGPSMSWHLGDIGSLSIDSNGYLVQQYITDTAQAGTWLYAFDTEYSEANIDSIRLSWESEGTLVVETSVDGTTWATAINNDIVSTLTVGTQPSHLFIRVIFTEGVVAKLHNLEIVGFKTKELNIPNRVSTITGSVAIRDSYSPIENRNDFGLKLNGGSLTIGNSTEDGYTGDLTWEMWYFTDNEMSVTIAASGADTFYLNGSLDSTSPEGSWNCVHLISADLGVIPSIIVSGDVVVGRLAAYPKALSADEVSNTYLMYTGKLKFSVEDSGITSISDPNVNAYSSDWSQILAG